MVRTRMPIRCVHLGHERWRCRCTPSAGRASGALPALALLLGLAVLGAAPTARGEASPAGVADAPEEVLITGERAGPRLWRVSDAQHSLWILGTVDQLPRKMIWRSDAVESLLAQAQLVIPGNSGVSIHAGPFAAVRLYLQWRGAQTNADHAPLKLVLPAPLYARFAALKVRYDASDRRIEQLRPTLAAFRLYMATEAAAGLGPGRQVQDTVLKLARHHGVKVAKLGVDIDDPKDVLAQFTHISSASEAQCLEATVARLETDLGPMRQRASAWAAGDVAALRHLPAPDNRAVCIDALSASPRIKELIKRAESQWLEAALAALRTNQTTVALRPINDLLAANGVLATLRARGYAVEGP